MPRSDRSDRAPDIWTPVQPCRVWVRLARVFPIHPNDLAPNPDGVKTGEGETGGVLLGWLDTWRGGRLGYVKFELSTPDGRRIVSTCQWLPEAWFELPSGRRRTVGGPRLYG
ncbi:hypothetical protein [Amycolatopsis sp. CA-230715]|uniref:hypothetical protein n=1 Tax=Amycolatopsis sp. CA-230715 TaxID=2745196 RepID=UPI001C017AC1|nr:hypothetical protein [Amycolatopsis sp. CA-230715]